VRMRSAFSATPPEGGASKNRPPHDAARDFIWLFSLP
jgi:hypothetical protein